MNWDEVFDTLIRAPGATDDEVDYLQERVLDPLSVDELAYARSQQRNPFPPTDPLHGTYHSFDPASWTIPKRRFPDSFVQFLRWSNGGDFINGRREMGIFGTGSIREYLLCYELPQYMPGAVPFAFDGGGAFYLFDMRWQPIAGEFPIVFSNAGNLGWADDEHVYVADSFAAACLGNVHPRDRL